MESVCKIEVSTPKRLYADQQATAMTDTESDAFKIERVTKQGDPLSSVLFNTVLQAASEDDLKIWREKGMAWAAVWVITKLNAYPN